MAPLVLCEIFGVFLNTLTSDGNYPVQDCQYLRLPIRMQLSGKPTRFSHFLCDFWNLHQILKFLKKKDPHSSCISQIEDCKNLG